MTIRHLAKPRPLISKINSGGSLRHKRVPRYDPGIASGITSWPATLIVSD